MRNLLQIQLSERIQHAFTISSNRKPLLFCLLLILFFTGVYTEKIYLLLDQFFYFLSTKAGFLSFLNNSQAEVSSLITMRSWPTMITYGLGFTGLCFITLHVYFNDFRKTKITAAFYASIFIFCLSLIVLGKIVPDFTWAYKLSRRIIELVVSPFPVVLLIAVFAGFKKGS